MHRQIQIGAILSYSITYRFPDTSACTCMHTCTRDCPAHAIPPPLLSTRAKMLLFPFAFRCMSTLSFPSYSRSPASSCVCTHYLAQEERMRADGLGCLTVDGVFKNVGSGPTSTCAALCVDSRGSQFNGPPANEISKKNLEKMN